MSGGTPPQVAVGIELSVGAGTVAARRGPRLVERPLASQRAHASDLLWQVSAALDELGASPRDLAAVVVGLGPGSFTGLRVAAACAQGLHLGCGARLRGVASVDALARSELRLAERGAILMDARAGELYVAVYERTKDGLSRLAAPRIARPAELDALLEGVDVLLADDDALAASGVERDRFRRAAACRPSAAQTLELGLEELAQLGPHQPASIEPLYLRAFAATRRKG